MKEQEFLRKLNDEVVEKLREFTKGMLAALEAGNDEKFLVRATYLFMAALCSFAHAHGWHERDIIYFLFEVTLDTVKKFGEIPGPEELEKFFESKYGDKNSNN